MEELLLTKFTWEILGSDEDWGTGTQFSTSDFTSTTALFNDCLTGATGRMTFWQYLQLGCVYSELVSCSCKKKIYHLAEGRQGGRYFANRKHWSFCVTVNILHFMYISKTSCQHRTQHNYKAEKYRHVNRSFYLTQNYPLSAPFWRWQWRYQFFTKKLLAYLSINLLTCKHKHYQREASPETVSASFVLLLTRAAPSKEFNLTLICNHHYGFCFVITY